VLERLGLEQAIYEHAGKMDEIRWLDQNGFLINRVSIPKSVALHRADLQTILLHALPPSWLKLGYSLVAYDTQKNKIVARFTNGDEIEADFLLGADGIHSDVRSQLLGDGPPSYRGYTVWRGIASLGPDSISANTAIEIHGRGQRFGIGPVGNGRVGWWATANATTQQHSNHDTQTELLRLFKGWYKPAVHLIEATPSEHILTTPAFDRAASSTWSDKRLTLLGDAIHPTTPNLGQGGCLAMEDAIVLARCFEKYGATQEALRKYEGCRQNRTAALTKYSRFYGTVGQWRNPFAQASRKFFLCLAPEPLLQGLVQIVFDYDATTVTV
jgi:2-polyprenyl-6-methoxyphenol hydroxylase-like FAD-dependent oxidoreductase